MNDKIKNFMVVMAIIATSFLVMAATNLGFPEGNAPKAGAGDIHSLQKINAILYDAFGGGGGGVWAGSGTNVYVNNSTNNPIPVLLPTLSYLLDSMTAELGTNGMGGSTSNPVYVSIPAGSLSVGAITGIGNQSTNSIGLSDGTNRAFVTASGELLVSGAGGSTNVSAVLTDRTNGVYVSTSGELFVKFVPATSNHVYSTMLNTTETNVWMMGGPGTNVALASLPQAPEGTNNVKQLGTWTANVGGFTTACTNSFTIATNAHTVGMAIASGEITNFFRADGGSAWLQTLTWTQFGQTNSDNKIFWFFSRPVTAVTNAALWGPTEADMMFLCSSPVKLGCDTNSLVPFGTSGFAQFATSLSRPMVNTWTNRELYWIATQDTVATAANTSNVVTTARVRVTSSQD